MFILIVFKRVAHQKGKQMPFYCVLHDVFVSVEMSYMTPQKFRLL